VAVAGDAEDPAALSVGAKIQMYWGDQVVAAGVVIAMHNKTLVNKVHVTAFGAQKLTCNDVIIGVTTIAQPEGFLKLLQHRGKGFAPDDRKMSADDIAKVEIVRNMYIK
jgi:hypothetical protein